MTHGLARQLGGALHLSSEVGHGTTVELFVPSTTKPMATPMTQQHMSREPTSAKLTVLVVDDDALIAMSTSMMVEDLGHEVVEVHSGCDALKEIRPRLPILIATGYAELSALSDLDHPRLRKPYEQEQLAAALADAIRASC